jgi:hypothetical protein
MKASEFDEYTEALRASLASRPEVVGLVTLGSTADPAFRDEWSDHDFWVITKPGAQDALVDDLSWLPGYQDIAITIKHLPHGRNVLFRDRHKVEFAVFSADEMRSGKVDRYRVLIDRDRIAELVESIRADSIRPARARAEALENLCVLVWSACERHYRGEFLSSRQYLDGFAINQLLSLIFEPGGATDALDPRRRVEQRSPELAAELLAALAQPVPQAALSLLQIAERELKSSNPTIALDTLEMVRGWISSPHRSSVY